MNSYVILIKVKGQCFMMKFDKEYLRLVRKILNEGGLVKDKQGIDMLEISKYDFELDLSKEFPILQSKQVFYRQAILMMLWIWQECSNDVRWLIDRNVHIYDELMIDEDGIYRIYEPVVKGEEYVYEPDKEVIVYDLCGLPKYDDKGNVMTTKSLKLGRNIKEAKYYGKDLAFTIGTTNGYTVGVYELSKRMEYILKNVPNERKGINNIFQNELLSKSIILPSIYCTEWDITNNKLNLFVQQRDCDVALALPYDVTGYAVFLQMMASVTGKEIGVLSWNIRDAYIRIEHINKINEQLDRWNLYQQMTRWNESDLIKRQLELSSLYEKAKGFIDSNELGKMDTELRIIDMLLNPSKPEIWLNPNIASFFEFDSSKDIKLKNYKHMGKIDFTS